MPARERAAGAPAPVGLLLTCEHGGNDIPARWRRMFGSATARAALASHRGHDIGALALARGLARTLRAPLIAATTSRLLIDLNRSLHNPAVFSEFTRALPATQRAAVVAAHYAAHRARVRRAIDAIIASGGVAVHVGVHSFTPALRGVVRTADIGLLYDPSRLRERALCDAWLTALRAGAPGLRVRRNYPYLGKSDGLVTALRRRHRGSEYVGVELEVNQALLRRGGADAERLRGALAASLVTALRLTPLSASRRATPGPRRPRATSTTPASRARRSPPRR